MDRVPRWFVWLAWCFLAGCAAFFGSNMAVVAAGSDSSGYLNSARLLASGQLHADLRIPPEFGLPAGVDTHHFSPQGFSQIAGNPRLPPSYPTGLPLHFALAGKILGWPAGPFLVQVLAAVGAVGFCYLTARQLGVSYVLAGAGAFMLATFPVFIFTSIQTLSDTLATTWTLITLWCALKAHARSWWAAAAGAGFAMAVLVRPTNLFLAPGLLLLLGFEARRLGAFVAGGLPGAVWLATYNYLLYGGMFRSGYGDFQSAFALHYGWPTAVHFLKWLALLLPAVVLVLPLAALSQWSRRGREIAALGLMIAGIIGLYLFYDVSHDVWWCLRFILPAVAVLILVAVLGTESIAQRIRSRWRGGPRLIIAIVLAGWAAGNSWYWTRQLTILYVPGYERAYEEAAKLIRERLPPNALVVCSAFSGAMYYYTALPTLIYHTLSPEDFANYATRARAAGRPIYAAIFSIEEEDAIRTRCPGSWVRIAAVGNIGIWELK